MDIIFGSTKIKSYLGDRSHSLGMDYYNRNMVHSTVKMGALLKGRCMGSEPYSYYVEVLFDVKQLSKITIDKAKCSCPVRYYCKHIAALLIAWNNKPDSFRNQQELIAYLTKQKKDWLVELLLEFAEKDSEVLERIFKIKDGRARRTRKGREI